MKEKRGRAGRGKCSMPGGLSVLLIQLHIQPNLLAVSSFQINDVPTKEELYPTSQIMAESFFSGAEAARASREIQQGPGSQEWLDLLEEVRREAAEARRRAVEARQSAAEAKRFAAEARRLAAEARKRQTALVQMQFWRERGVLMLRFATSAVIRW